MFRRPGESNLQAQMRHSRESAQANWQRNMAGKAWLDQQIQQVKPAPRDYTRQQNQQLTSAAIIREMRPEFGVEHQGVWGIDIHLTFTIFGAKDRTFAAAAHFFFASGEPLMDRNGDYSAQNGTVCVWRVGQPEPTYFGKRREVLFMPYAELHLQTGDHDLTFFASIWDEQWTRLARSNWYPFTLQVT